MPTKSNGVWRNEPITNRTQGDGYGDHKPGTMILRGDARHLPLVDETVQCVVTSPPYWGLRDYQLGDKGIGLERTLEEYIAVMVEVFREVRRVLKPSGTVWLNLGDSYSSIGHKKSNSGYGTTGLAGGIGQEHSPLHRENNGAASGLKHKDLCMIPARVALALQADGWWLRSEITLCKRNPMPESCEDRPTSATEKLFLLTKSARYFYDADAVAELSECDRLRGPALHGDLLSTNRNGGLARRNSQGRRNKRNWWEIVSEPNFEAHFASFPQALVLPCILAGTSAKGECIKCGKNWERVTEKYSNTDPEERRIAKLRAAEDGVYNGSRAGSGLHAYPPDVITLGWRPTCKCNADTRPNLVLDPFGGTSTVGIVAERLGRRWVTVELSPAYIEIAKRRTAQHGLFRLNQQAAMTAEDKVR